MKTSILILFLTCFSLWAQSNPPSATNTVDPALSEKLRQRMRAALSNNPPQAFPSLSSPAPAQTLVLPTNTSVPTNAPTLTATNTPPGTAKPPAGNVTGAVSTVTPGATTSPAAQASGTAAAPETMLQPGEIDFQDIDLDQVLEVYAQLVGRTVLRAQLPQVKIKLRTQTPLTKKEAIQALDSVLAMNGVTVIGVGDKFVKVVPLSLAPAQAALFNTNDMSKLPEADEYVSQIIQLKYAKPTEMIPILSPFAQIPNSILAVDSSQILVIRDYSANVKRMLELIKQIDVIVPMDFDSEVIPIKYAQATDIASALNSLGSGGSGGTSIGRGSSVGGGGSGRSGGGLNGGGLGGGLGGQNSLGGGLGGQNSLGGGLGGGLGGQNNLGGGTAGRSSTFSDRLNGIIQKAGAQGDFRILGTTKIIADQRTNSLLVFATKQDMAMIHKIVKELDIVLAQVLIEGIIMEVTLDRGQNVGFSYLQTTPSSPGNYFSGVGAINNVGFLNASNILNASTNSIGGGLSYFGNFGSDFQATLTAIATDDRINVLSKPRVQTSHGVPANISVGQTVPEVSGTYFGGINGQASSQYNQQFVGISLNVTPLINPDGLVVMDITANVQALGPNYTIDNNTVPSTTQRSASSTVSVRDRETIILGGMISTSKSTSHSGVPFLKDIPGLGFLFRSSNDSLQRTELIILLKPTVLPSPESAALVAAHERARLPGIKAAERDDAVDENRRLKEADSIKVPPVRE